MINFNAVFETPIAANVKKAKGQITYNKAIKIVIQTFVQIIHPPIGIFHFGTDTLSPSNSCFSIAILCLISFRNIVTGKQIGRAHV